MKIQLPIAVQHIITTLENNGFEAYAVGGCVRDCLLGVTPKDWDITTSAQPQEIKGLFSHTIDTGIEHGTVTVMIDHVGYEVTTYRIDGEYEDGRHPKEVLFTNNLIEDLKRRDFTINAMAYNEKTGLIDEFCGEQDLEKQIVKAVGDAKTRFTEDALRMLRAVRFAAKLGFAIEENTFEAMKELAPTLSRISVERIYTEFSKTLESDHPEDILKSYDAGLMDVYLPEVAGVLHQNPDSYKEIAGILKDSPKELWLREGLLLFYYLRSCEKPVEVSKILRRLKVDNDTRKTVDSLTALWLKSQVLSAEEVAIRMFLSQYDYGQLMRYTAGISLLMEEKKQQMEDVLFMAQVILRRGDCVKIKDLALDGQDLIALGVPQGKKIGEILGVLLNEVIWDPSLNKKEILREIAEEYVKTEKLNLKEG